MKFRGRVIEGQKLARTLGVPTANLSFSQRPKIKDGVWLVRVFFEGKIYGGVLHAGIRQTDKQWAIEVHLLEFVGELRGKILEIETIKFVRETKRFDSLFALKSQIHLDVVHARKFFIRETIRVHWDMLPQTEREQLSKSAVARVSELPEFQSSTFVYLFAPDTREINFVQQLCSEFNDKIYAFPRIEEKKINFYSSRFEDLREGKFRILEPVGDVSASSPDLILVPAVAAAITGERLGRGGGFYDAFLAQVDAPTVCVLPEWAVLNDVPFEAHDQRVGKVIGV